MKILNISTQEATVKVLDHATIEVPSILHKWCEEGFLIVIGVLMNRHANCEITTYEMSERLQELVRLQSTTANLFHQAQTLRDNPKDTDMLVRLVSSEVGGTPITLYSENFTLEVTSESLRAMLASLKARIDHCYLNQESVPFSQLTYNNMVKVYLDLLTL